MRTKLWSESPKERNHWEDVDMDERILKWNINKYSMRVQT